MYVILLVSVVALALFAERAVFLYVKLRMNVESSFQKIMVALDTMNYRGAIEECTRLEHHPGLLKADMRDKDIERTLEEHILKEIPVVKARINLLTMFANISTLLGLLGTIVGLIGAFQGVSGANAAMKQEILANGISVAMLTTAFGLIVAIPCLAGYYILNNRGEFIIDQFEEKDLSLFNKLSTLKLEKGGA